jgi:hypothetical protein
MIVLNDLNSLIEDRINFFNMIIESQSITDVNNPFMAILNDFKKAKQHIEYLCDENNTDELEIGMRCAFLKYNTIDHIKEMVEKAKEEKSNWRNQSMVININSTINKYENAINEIMNLITHKNY